MNREFLKGLELSDEHIESIMKEHGKSVNTLKEEKETAETKAKDVDELKKQIKERDTQLGDLSKKAKGNDELEKKIKDLQTSNETTQTEYQSKLDQQQFDFALEKAITGKKARNPKAVKALLNTESIKLDGDKLLGLDEQLKGLKESDSYLFGESDKLGGRDPHNSDPNGSPQKVTKDQFNQMGYTDREKLYSDNPELYNQLTN